MWAVGPVGLWNLELLAPEGGAPAVCLWGLWRQSPPERKLTWPRHSLSLLVTQSEEHGQKKMAVPAGVTLVAYVEG